MQPFCHKKNKIVHPLEVRSRCVNRVRHAKEVRDSEDRCEGENTVLDDACILPHMAEVGERRGTLLISRSKGAHMCQTFHEPECMEEITRRFVTIKRTWLPSVSAFNMDRQGNKRFSEDLFTCFHLRYTYLCHTRGGAKGFQRRAKEQSHVRRGMSRLRWCDTRCCCRHSCSFSTIVFPDFFFSSGRGYHGARVVHWCGLERIDETWWRVHRRFRGKKTHKVRWESRLTEMSHRIAISGLHQN